VTTQSRLAYDAGSNVLTLVLVRVVLFTLLFGAFLPLRRQPMRLGVPGVVATLWMSALLLVMATGYLGSVAYIPVSLAALIFYSFPFYVALLAFLSGRESMTRRKTAALVVAFIGLALALGPSFDHLDWRGIACALVGAVAFATTFAFGGAVMRQNDLLLVNVCINAWMALGLGAYMLAADRIALPVTSLGWIGLGGATLSYLIAFTAWFLSLRLVSPIRVAILFNIEPLITIAAAWIVLGEELTPIQSIGAGLVVAAIVGMTGFSGRRSTDVS
jgi:drug/metabolite transporter (DMT)-like permease